LILKMNLSAQLPAASRQLPAASCQPPVASRKRYSALATGNWQLATGNCADKCILKIKPVYLDLCPNHERASTRNT
jgi:hypothetical protein